MSSPTSLFPVLTSPLETTPFLFYGPSSSQARAASPNSPPRVSPGAIASSLPTPKERSDKTLEVQDSPSSKLNSSSSPSLSMGTTFFFFFLLPCPIDTGSRRVGLILGSGPLCGNKGKHSLGVSIGWIEVFYLFHRGCSLRIMGTPRWVILSLNLLADPRNHVGLAPLEGFLTPVQFPIFQLSL
jgi:hypothetical protein